MATNPTLLTQPIAANGAKNAIPNTTATPGAMSQDQGFPAETSLPLGAGGVAPSREDFNGAFNLLSELLFYAQKGWQFEFDESQNYFAGCIVRDTLDNKLYEAINDVSASSTHPSADSVNWKESGTDMSAYTTTVNSPMFNKRDVITTSGTYIAPVTGWYKITVKGGGGGGAGGRNNTGNAYTSGAGGSEGGTTIAYERMTAGDTAIVTIGAGGNGGSVNINFTGADGGDSTVVVAGNSYTAGGGGGGYSTKRGGSGTIWGSAGGQGARLYTSAGQVALGGMGGGAGGTADSLTMGIDGGGGAGGNGGSTADAGSAGGDGYAWFEYFDSTLNP